jgi:hypothetical protein
VDEITFRNKREDLETYYEYFVNTEDGKQLGKKVFVARIWFNSAILALLFFLFWGGLGYLRFSIRSTVILAFGFIFFLATIITLALLVFRPYQFVAKQILKKNEKSLTEKDLQLLQLPRTIKITDDWLELRTSAAVHQWRWGLVDAIGLTSRFIFLQVGTCHIYYIPQRDFSSDEEFREFGNRLVELHKEKKDQSFVVGTVV